MPVLIDFFLLALLGVTALALLKHRNLFAVVLLAGIYSLLSAGLFTVMDAGRCGIHRGRRGGRFCRRCSSWAPFFSSDGGEAPPKHSRVLPLAVVFVTGAILVYGTLDMPAFGDPGNPAHHHVAPRYLEEMPHEIGIPNAVTAVLASYRGYDTLGETTVVFTAVIGILILLGGRRRRAESGGPDEAGKERAD